MAGYTAQLESAAAIAADAGFAWLMAVANTGFSLKRVTLGVRAGTSTVTDMNAVVGINRVTTAGTTPTNGPAPHKLDNQRAANQAIWASAFATPPTVASTDAMRIPLNTKTTVDLPLYYVQGSGTAGGFAFINRSNALPASTVYVITVEWEE